MNSSICNFVIYFAHILIFVGTMGAIASTIGGWLKAGFDLAATPFKWIWEKVCALYSKVCDAARSLFPRLEVHYSCRNERSYVTITEPGRVEVRSEF